MPVKDYQKDLVVPEALRNAYDGMKNVAVSEVFQSFQGEGRNAGKNSVFVRFWGCNLACTWCDTPYSWQADKVDHMVKIPAKFVAELIATKFPTASNVIFTGGEPSLFEDGIAAIVEEMERLGIGWMRTEIETNGSRKLKNHYDQINVSPKLPSSGNRPYPVLVDSPKADFKFVVGDTQDLEAVETLLGSMPVRPSPDRVWLMPLGTTAETQLEISRSLLVPYCLSNGYNLAVRNQILLFGDVKGT